jgi:hypothetical protein
LLQRSNLWLQCASMAVLALSPIYLAVQKTIAVYVFSKKGKNTNNGDQSPNGDVSVNDQTGVNLTGTRREGPEEVVMNVTGV